MTTVDIDVSESSSTPVGNSLQLGGTGTTAEDFSWQSDAPSTFGTCNIDQSFTIEVPLPHNFVLLADNKIKIGGQVVSAGDIHSNDKIDFKKGNPSTHSGNLTAKKDIKIDKDNTIDGDATAGGKVDVKKDATINGTITENANVDIVALPTISFGAGGNDVKVPDGGSQSLTPGSYGKVKVEKRGTLILTDGDYFFEELDLKDDATLSVSISKEPVVINTVNKLHFHKRTQVIISSWSPNTSELVTFNSMKKVELFEGSRVLGTIIAPEDEVKIKKSVFFKGSICAKEITVNKDGTLLHHDSNTSLSKAAPVLAATEDAAVSVGSVETTPAVPTEFALEQNYPNPFNPTTTIRFRLPDAGHVSVRIFNTLGQEIRLLVENDFGPGLHSIIWDGRNDNGNSVSSGLYLYQIQSGKFSQVKKMTLLK